VQQIIFLSRIPGLVYFDLIAQKFKVCLEDFAEDCVRLDN